ncbi:MAG: hypothetical protein K0R84_2046 [Clostridia bacterium]|nr:hypothetical protein [Clostridia bacterium]
MEEKELVEIRDGLATLPELNKRLKRLNERISDAEQEVSVRERMLAEESNDVDRLERESLSAALFRFIGKYEEKMDKETQEMLAAKLNYDKAAGTLKEFNSERDELTARIAKLERAREAYKQELFNREQRIQNSIIGEAIIQYRQLESEREELTKQLFEIQEAQSAVYKVRATADNVMQHLESAEGWATYDAWTRGGIFSHMAKYDHIDNAQEEFNRLAVQLKEMHKELLDVDMLEDIEITEISGTTRAFDFWFDNIFTDLNVRDQISANIDQLNKLYSKLDSIMGRLQNSKQETEKMLEENEYKKNDLLIFNA